MPNRIDITPEELDVLFQRVKAGRLSANQSLAGQQAGNRAWVYCHLILSIWTHKVIVKNQLFDQRNPPGLAWEKYLLRKSTRA